MRTILVIAANVQQFAEFIEPVIAANPKATAHRNDTVLRTFEIEFAFVHDAAQLYGPDRETTTVLPLFMMKNVEFKYDVAEKEKLFEAALARFREEPYQVWQ